MRKFLLGGLVVISVLTTGLVGAGLYDRYFDARGGALCEVRHEAVHLQKVNMCDWTGVSLEVLTHFLTDVRNTADPHMVLIKYKSGIVYQCYWFDDRKFDYWIDGVQSPMADGCSDRPRTLTMTRRLKHD